MIDIFERMNQIRAMRQPDQTAANLDRFAQSLGAASHTLAGMNQQRVADQQIQAQQGQQQELQDWQGAWALAHGLDASGQPLSADDPDFQRWQADPDRERKYNAMAQYGSSLGLIKPQAQAKQPQLLYKRMSTPGGVDHIIGFDRATGQRVADLGPAGQAGGTTVNVGAGETEFAKGIAKQSVTQITDINQSISQNRKQSQKLGALESEVRKIPEGSFLTGSGLAPMALAAGKYAKAFGMDIEGLSGAETIQALNNELAVGSRTPGSGTFTDMDMQVYKSINAGLQDTREGFMNKIKLKRKAMKYEDKFSRMKQSYIRKNKSDEGFQEFALEWQEKNPFQDTIKTLIGEPSIQMEPVTSADFGAISTADLEAELKALEGQ